jgi:hypothetical protein
MSASGTLAAVGILLAYLIEIWTDPESSKPVLSHQLIFSCGVFLLAVVVVAVEVWPASDETFARHVIQPSHVSHRMDRGLNQIAEAFSFRPAIALASLGLSLLWMFRIRVALYFVLPAALLLAFSTLVYGSPWHAGTLFLLWLFAMWIATDRNPGTLPLHVWAAWVMVLGPYRHGERRVSGCS